MLHGKLGTRYQTADLFIDNDKVFNQCTIFHIL
jgi:hypothetical protein